MNYKLILFQIVNLFVWLKIKLYNFIKWVLTLLVFYGIINYLLKYYKPWITVCEYNDDYDFNKLKKIKILSINSNNYNNEKVKQNLLSIFYMFLYFEIHNINILKKYIKDLYGINIHDIKIQYYEKNYLSDETEKISNLSENILEHIKFLVINLDEKIYCNIDYTPIEDQYLISDMILFA